MWTYLKILCFLVYASYCHAQSEGFLHILAEKYERPFTMLDLSPSISNISLDLADTYRSSVFIGLARNDYLVTENCLLINNLPSLTQLQKLLVQEHFDIVYVDEGLAKLNNRFEYLQIIAKIADHVILNLDSEFAKLIPEFLEEIKACPIGHTTDYSKKRTYLIRNALAKQIAPWPNNDKIEISSNFHYRVGAEGQSKKPWPEGISLFSFKLLDGILPNTDALAKQLQNSNWQQSLTLPYCVFLQGNQVHWHHANPSLRVWPEEGLNSCLIGIQVPQNQYESYCKDEFRRLLLPN